MAGLTKSPRKQTNKQIPLIKTYGIIYMGYILFRPLHRNVCLLVQFPSFSILFHKLRALYKQVTIKKKWLPISQQWFSWAHAFSPSTWEAEASGLPGVQGQLGLTLSQNYINKQVSAPLQRPADPLIQRSAWSTQLQTCQDYTVRPFPIHNNNNNSILFRSQKAAFPGSLPSPLSQNY